MGAPDGQQHEPYQRNAEVPWRMHGARPNWVVERSTQYAYDCGVDTPHHGLHTDMLPEGVPERKCAEQDKDPRQEDACQAERRPGEPVRLRRHHRAEIRREGEERAGTAWAAR
jgi:hypothetical protein